MATEAALTANRLVLPANRIGHAVYTTAQLKTMRKVITLVVFAGFSVLYLKEPLGWTMRRDCIDRGGCGTGVLPFPATE